MNLFCEEVSQGQLESVFETASEGIFVVSGDGHILRTNPAFDRLLGYGKDELKEKLFTEIVHDKEANVQKLTHHITLYHFQRSSTLPIEMELINKKEIDVPVRLRSTLIKNDKGKVVKAIGVVEALREYKGGRTLEQSVHETEETLQNVLANSGDAVFVADVKGQINIVNKALLQMLDYQEDEVIGMHLTELSPYEGSYTTTTGEKVVLTEEYLNYHAEKADELFEKGRVTNYELYFIRKDGITVPVEATISVLKDKKGERRGSIAICRDITERKLAEKEVKKVHDELERKVEERTAKLKTTNEQLNQQIIEREKEEYEKTKRAAELAEINEQLRREITVRKLAEEELRNTRDHLDNLIESSLDGILVTDWHGCIVRANRTFLEMIGYEEEEVIGKHTYEFTPMEGGTYKNTTGEWVKIDEEFINQTREMIKGLYEKRRITGWESYYLSKDRKVVPVEFNIAFLQNEKGETTGAVSICRDISERKKTEREVREARDYSDNIIDSSLDGIIVVDNTGSIIRANKSFLELVGYEGKEVIGKHVVELTPTEEGEYESTLGELLKIDKEVLDNSQRMIEILHEKGKVTHWESYYLRKDKKVVPVEMSIVLLHNKEEDITGYVGINRDITERKKAEREIKGAKEFLENIFKTSVDGIIISDPKGHMNMVNEAVEKMLGYSKGELMGKYMAELVPAGEGSKERAMEFVSGLFEKGVVYGSEHTWVKKDGMPVDVEISAALLKDTEGNVTGAVSSIRDIAERKQAANQLTLFRKFAEASGQGLGMGDLEGRITYANPALCRIFGEEKLEDVIGKHLYDCYPEKLLPKLKNEIIPALLKQGYQEVEMPIKSRDGEIIPVIQSMFLIRNDEGTPLCFANVITDITERKRAEDTLRESEEKFRSVFESATDFLCIINRIGIIVQVNPAMIRALGYSKNEIIGKSISDFFTPASQELFVKRFRVLMDEEAYQDEFELLRKDGRVIIVESAISSLYDNEGNIYSYVIIERDITERKRAEKELRRANEELEISIERANQLALQAEMANVSKSEFLANMSHEIRTPMNGVLGFTDLLLETELNSEQEDYVNTIKRSGDSLLALINDILDFSKIESGRMDLEEIDFDPELTAYDVFDLIKPKVEKKPVELLCRIADELPSYVKGDPARFRQVLINLMGNAVKFTHGGEIELSLEIEEENEYQIKLHARVRDTGIGIPKGKLESIFDPFKQADGSTTREYGGTGLGLSICKRISKAMEGDVWAESPADLLHPAPSIQHQASKIGPGSVFHFTAFFKKSAKKPSYRWSHVSIEGKRVLVADDNQNNLAILTYILSSVGVRVEPVSKAEEVETVAINALNKGDPFDLAILDVQMPEMNGYEIAKRFRQSEGLRTIPLLAFSSSAVEGAKKCQEVGFDGFLPKPVHRQKIVDMVKRLLRGEDKVSQTLPGTGDLSEERRKGINTQHTLGEEVKHSVRILLVEDNPVNQKLAEKMLTKAGYQVDIANNGQEAVDLYKKSGFRGQGSGDSEKNGEGFNLIFMDVQMPVLDGLKATEKIRSFEHKLQGGLNKKQSAIVHPVDSPAGDSPQAEFHKAGAPSVTGRIPIIAMTANAMEGDREKCINAGMDDYISKPIKREVVFEIVKQWVKR